MNETIDRIAHLLASAHQAERGLVLLFDYDGTLTPIVEHPRLAVLAPETRTLLEEVAGLPRVAVGVISGRALFDLKEMVGVPGLCYAGTNGLELEIQNTAIPQPDAVEFGDRVSSLAECLQDPVAAVPGAWIERKPMGITVHYRDVSANRVSKLRHGLDRILRPVTSDWRILDGPMAIEITPAQGRTKSTALRLICERQERNVIPLYAGDHASDADALEAAAEMGGIAIGVGPEAPLSARYHLPDPGALVRLLSRVSAALKSPIPGT